MQENLLRYINLLSRTDLKFCEQQRQSRHVERDKCKEKYLKRRRMFVFPCVAFCIFEFGGNCASFALARFVRGILHCSRNVPQQYKQWRCCDDTCVTCFYIFCVVFVALTRVLDFFCVVVSVCEISAATREGEDMVRGIRGKVLL